jgi:hypothetical protein
MTCKPQTYHVVYGYLGPNGEYTEVAYFADRYAAVQFASDEDLRLRPWPITVV